MTTEALFSLRLFFSHGLQRSLGTCCCSMHLGERERERERETERERERERKRERERERERAVSKSAVVSLECNRAV